MMVRWDLRCHCWRGGALWDLLRVQGAALSPAVTTQTQETLFLSSTKAKSSHMLAAGTWSPPTSLSSEHLLFELSQRPHEYPATASAFSSPHCTCLSERGGVAPAERPTNPRDPSATATQHSHLMRMNLWCVASGTP